MLAQIREKLFPCEKVMKSLMADHAESVRKNRSAHENFRVVCGEGFCFQGNFIPKIGEQQSPKS